MAERYEAGLNAVVMEITNRCNLRCPHCASASGIARPDEMSLDEVRGVISDIASLGCKVFTMLGGEALLRPDWFDIAKAVRQAGIELTIITNGLVVTPEVREKLKDVSPRVVAVSLDGATPESYKATRGVDGFAKCRRVLDDLVSDGLRQVSAITTFSSNSPVSKMFFRCLLMPDLSTPNNSAIAFCVSQIVSSFTKAFTEISSVSARYRRN